MRTFWQDLHKQAQEDLTKKQTEESARLQKFFLEQPGASSFSYRRFPEEIERVYWLSTWAEIEKSGAIEALRRDAA